MMNLVSNHVNRITDYRRIERDRIIYIFNSLDSIPKGNPPDTRIHHFHLPLSPLSYILFAAAAAFAAALA